MTDFDRLKSDQVQPEPENGERPGPSPDTRQEPGNSSGQGAGVAPKRRRRILSFLALMSCIFIFMLLLLMRLTPNESFLLSFKVKAEPLDKISGWFLIRPEVGQETELFTLAVAREAEAVYPDEAEPEGLQTGEPDRPKALVKDNQGAALMMIGCVEGQVMPPTFAFDRLVPAEADYALPHPPKPCTLRYQIDDAEELKGSCVFDGLVASLVQPPGPRDHLGEPGLVLLNTARLGRRLMVHLRVDSGQGLTAYFDISQLALAQVRLQRECGSQ